MAAMRSPYNLRSMRDLAIQPRDLGIGRLFESIRDAVIVVDASTGQIVLWNPAATDIFGYSPSEALNLRIDAIVPERLRERHQAGMTHYHETGHGKYIDSHALLDLPALRKSGEEIRVEMTLSPISPIHEGADRGSFALAVIRDVTRRKRVEEELRKSEERYRALAENAMDLVIVQRPDNTLSYVSPSVKHLLGYEPEEMVGVVGADYIHPEDLEWAWDRFREMLQTPGISEPVILRYLHKDGSWRYFESICNNQVDDPSVGGLVFNCRDITERVLAEEEIRQLNETLDARVRDRTEQLEEALRELISNERRLRENEERFRALVRHASDMILILDTEGTILYESPAVERILGYRPEERVGTSAFEHLHPDDIVVVRSKLAGFLNEAEDHVTIEYRTRDKEGSWRYFEAIGTNMLHDPVIKGIVVNSRDITERKKADEERAFLAAIVDSSDDAIIGKTLEGIITSWNSGARKLYGYPAEEAVGSPISILVPPERPDEIPEILNRLKRGEKIDHLETVRVTKDGRRLNISLTISPIKDSRGNITGASTIARDITGRKKVEAAIQESEQRYRAVVEQAAEGIFLVDVDTKRILEANAVYQKLLGYTTEEILGLTLYDVAAYSRENMDCYVELVLEKRVYVSGERRHRRKDGSLVDVEVSASVISYGGRETLCILARDITERKRAEMALQEVREAERRRMARDLHDGVLQDLTYALAEMQIIQSISEEQGLDGRLDQAVGALRRAGQGLRGAVYDLRLGEARDQPFSRLLKSLVELNRKMTPGCDIRLVIEDGFPSEPLGEAGTELLRIIQEVLSNARRHAAARSVWVRLWIEDEDMLAEVTDDGRGFGPDASSSGIGLKSMRERATALGGDLIVNSEPGEGTRVRFRASLSGFRENVSETSM